MPVLAAPRHVPGVLGDEDRAEVLARGRDDPDPARPGHPDVPALVALHPVRDALLDDAGTDAFEEHAAVRDRPVGRGVVDLDVRPWRVVDVEERLVRVEADAVRHLELVLLDDQLEVAAARRDAVDALEAEAPLARMPEAREAPVPRVGEVDAAVRVHADVVRAVQLLALELLGDDLARSVRALLHERARDVLADEQVEVGVVRHPVALVREVPHLDDRAVRRVLAPHVTRHVREEEVMLLRVPDRPLREREAGCHPLDLRSLLDELVDRVRLRFDAEACLGARHRAPFRGGMVGATLIRCRAPRQRIATPPLTSSVATELAGDGTRVRYVREHDLVAVGVEPSSDRLADPASRSRDDCRAQAVTVRQARRCRRRRRAPGRRPRTTRRRGAAPASRRLRGTRRWCPACRGRECRGPGRASSRRSDQRARGRRRRRPRRGRGCRSIHPPRGARRRRCRSSCGSGGRRRACSPLRRLSARRAIRWRRAWLPPDARGRDRRPRARCERAEPAVRRRPTARRSTGLRPGGPRPAGRRSSSRRPLRARRRRRPRCRRGSEGAGTRRRARHARRATAELASR